MYDYSDFNDPVYHPNMALLDSGFDTVDLDFFGSPEEPENDQIIITAFNEMLSR